MQGDKSGLCSKSLNSLMGFQERDLGGLFVFVFAFFFFEDMMYQVLIVAHRIFIVACRIFHCSHWFLVEACGFLSSCGAWAPKCAGSVVLG